MERDDAGSVSHWIVGLKAGDQDAVRSLWDRYFDDLVRLARVKIRQTGRPGAEADEEDAALSAFKSFYEGVTNGAFPLLTDRHDLWRLLVVITARKAWALADRRGRQKRGGHARIVSGDGIEETLVATEPTPELAAMIAEEYDRLLDTLGDESLRQVAVWKLDGYTVDEIADRLGCARRTVARRLDLIRKTWIADAPSIDPE